jgi:NUMOD3 motif
MSNVWTDEEITLLKQIYPKASIERVLQSLPQHSFKSIWQKASDLGIHRGVAGTNNPFYGKTHSDETRRKISAAKMGMTPWNYHIPMSEEQKKKLSESRRGKGLGRIPWNKGVPTTAAAKHKIRIANLGRKHTLDELARMRRCSLNENVFDNVTEESAYWIGMFSVSGNNLSHASPFLSSFVASAAAFIVLKYRL